MSDITKPDNLQEGSEESGFHGHAGVPGVQGGSAPSGNANPDKAAANRARVAAFRAKKKAEKEGTSGHSDMKVAAQRTGKPPKPAGSASSYDTVLYAMGIAFDPIDTPDNKTASDLAMVYRYQADGVSLRDDLRLAANKAYSDNDPNYKQIKDYLDKFDPYAQVTAAQARDAIKLIGESHATQVMSMANVYDSSRGIIKDRICNEIQERGNRALNTAVDNGELTYDQAEAKRVSYDEIDETIRAWAGSSGDDSKVSIAAQQAAAKLFGVDAGHYAVGSSGLSVKPNASQRDTASRVIEAMYAHTQAVLGQQGIKTLTLYRGVKLDNPATHTLEGRQEGPLDKVEAGDTFTFHGNPMSSWSLSPGTATRFASPGYSQKGLVLAMEVPVERVVGSCISGYGCFNEQEVVVTGGVEDTALVVYTR